jgi:hypothetical protein
VVIPLAVGTAAVGVTLGALTGLRALAAARHSLTARVFGSLLVLTGGISGARLGSAAGAAWGLAVGETLASAVWWHQLVRALQASAARRRAPAT